MARNKDHERTQVTAVREDIREEMERALSGTSLPVPQKQEVVTRVGAMLERYTSPYPHPDVLRQIEALAPGSTELIVRTAAETIKHNNAAEDKELAIRDKELDLIKTLATEDYSSVRQGRRYGLFAFACILIFAGIMYYLGAEKLSYVAFGIGSIGIVSQLISGGHKIKISRDKEEADNKDDEKGIATKGTS